MQQSIRKLTVGITEPGKKLEHLIPSKNQIKETPRTDIKRAKFKTFQTFAFKVELPLAIRKYTMSQQTAAVV